MVSRSALVAVLVMLSGSALAQSADGLAAADRLIAVQDLKATMTDMATGMSKSLPEKVRAPFVEEMTDDGFIGRYKVQMRTVMAKNFTVEELNALADFYSKPIARSAMSKMGNMMTELMPFIQGEMPELIKRVQAKVPKP